MPVLQYSARLACARASPLVCVNQALVSELDIIRSARTLEGEARSALSYSRAIAVVKGAHGLDAKLPSSRIACVISHAGTNIYRLDYHHYVSDSANLLLISIR